MEYTYDELEESIKPENLIGEGGFGQVYKGSARSTSIAVKVLFEVMHLRVHETLLTWKDTNFLIT